KGSGRRRVSARRRYGARDGGRRFIVAVQPVPGRARGTRPRQRRAEAMNGTMHRTRSATRVIATVVETSTGAIDRTIEGAARDGADAVEVRFDAAPGVSPEDVGCGASVPLIAACRTVSDGGAFQGSESDRVDLLVRAARTGRFKLDVEQ